MGPRPQDIRPTPATRPGAGGRPSARAARIQRQPEVLPEPIDRPGEHRGDRRPTTQGGEEVSHIDMPVARPAPRPREKLRQLEDEVVGHVHVRTADEHPRRADHIQVRRLAHQPPRFVGGVDGRGEVQEIAQVGWPHEASLPQAAAFTTPKPATAPMIRSWVAGSRYGCIGRANTTPAFCSETGRPPGAHGKLA